LEAVLSPELFSVDCNGAIMQPVALMEKVAARLPKNLEILDLPLFAEPGRSVRFAASGTGAEMDFVTAVQFFVNPCNGEILGSRQWGELSLAAKNLMPLLNRIHYSLALGNFGSYLLGIIAVFWTLDCFVGLYLTFPKCKNAYPQHPVYWLQKWKKAWLIKMNASFIRLNFDLHIAFGLWTWAALLLFAWSSVAFNLPEEVYNPVTRWLFGMEEVTQIEASPADGVHKPEWRQALLTGRHLLKQLAQSENMQILYEDSLAYNPLQNTYDYKVKSNLDVSKWASTQITFSTETGRLIKSTWPGHPNEKMGDVITRWLIWLHMAVVFGTGMQIFVCFLGLVITLLSLTGIYIWWRKKKASKKLQT